MTRVHRLGIVALVASLAGCEGEGQQKKAPPTLEDAQALARVVETASALGSELEDHRPLFTRDSDEALTPEERTTLLSLWAPLIDLDLAFASYRSRFLHDWGSAQGKDGAVRALTLGVSALSAQTLLRLKLLRLVAGKEVLRTALNEPAPEFGIVAGHYDALLLRTAQPTTMLLLERASDVVREKTEAMRKNKRAEDGKYAPLAERSLQAIVEVQEAYDSQIVRLAAQATRVATANQLDRVVDPLVQNIAEWLGDTRLRHSDASLISAGQIDTLQTRLDPGDVLVERRNWYLSNLGLPGFWPHSELYVGTPDELSEYFDADAEVRALYPQGLAAFLQTTYPEAWHAYVEAAEDGRPRRIIEAISDGVSLTSLHEAAQADYVAAMRPRVSKLVKAQALARAFSHFGKPYDFDFDFLTVSTLVCSELVYQAYLGPRGEGVVFPLSTVIGRLTLPPNDMVRMFDEEYGTDAQQLDFVAFLDGREGSDTAVDADVEAFRASWPRPQWDLTHH